MIGGEYEKGLSDYSSHDAALSGPNAIRIFSTGEIFIYTGVWCDGIPILSGAEGMAGLYLWNAGIALSTFL